MKLTKKIASLALAALLLLTAFPTQVLSFALERGATAIKDEVLFSSSFEASDPTVTPSQSDNGYYQNLTRFDQTVAVAGEFTASVNTDSLEGSADFKAEEGKSMLFDSSSSTKFLTSTTPSATSPVWVTFSLDTARTVAVYVMTSANDESARDPKNWTLYGSVNGSDYTPIDTQVDQYFSGRNLSKTYTVADPQAYRYYKLEITANNGAPMTQLADLRFGTGENTDGASGDSPMQSVVTNGPESSWVSAGAFDGKQALSVYAEQSAKTESYARNLLYADLGIRVTKNTKLSYVHFPSIEHGYDYEYTAMYLSVDVKFTDGTYLSSLNAVDQNGFGMDPVSKGDSASLYSNQWNYVETNLGDVAEGKTIDSLYVYYHKEQTVELHRFTAYFDDLVIENRADVTYEHLSDYINTLRGTNSTTSFSRGLTTPFCAMPNGFNLYTPVTNSGSNTHYSYSADSIVHFSVSHVPSTWTGDYGTWQFMANTSLDTSNLASISSGKLQTSTLGATFRHDNEIAKAHYYSVTFEENSRASGVKVEMTPTTHGLYVRFTFPEDAENVNIVFDNVRSGGSLTLNDDGSFTAKSNHTDRGSTPLQVVGAFDQTPKAVKSTGSVGVVVFPQGTTEVTMKFATSFLTAKQAAHNLELEIPDGATFDSTFAKAQKAWDDICGIIEVEGASYTELVTLYSNLYRMYSYPNLYSENEGTNEEPVWVYASPYRNGRKTSGKLYVNNGFWDTYRTAWAAYALLTPTFDGELLDGILQHYRDNGWIPRWVAPGGTNSMLGTSSDIIFADAYVKGIEFDSATAFESMLKNAATVPTNVTNGGRAENNTAIFTGYVSNATQYGFSWTMEDYISDYCIGVMAAALGYTDEAEYYFNRSRFYVNTFNTGARFFMGKNAAGSWSSPSNFNPAAWWGDYSETNAWTMAFAPVYDGAGLAALYGGKSALLKKLNDYFDNSLEAMKKVADGSIHEMVEAREVRMGQYSHSNQPAHAIPYLYVYVDAPYRTQEIVREVLSRLYVGSEIGQGYCGDEDNGEMSAWYVLSALGLYPQNMGSGEYVIGSPLFDKMTVHMDNGNDLVVIANNNSDENIYVQSLTVNGQAHNEAFIDHEVVANGATLVFEMGNTPSEWGTDSAPTSLTSTGKKADPAEDLVTSRYAIRDEAFTGTLANAVYVGTIADAQKLFDNDSNTYTTVADGDSVVFASKNASRLLLCTVSCSAKTAAPQSLKLEASVNGTDWLLLSEQNDLTYDWNKYTRAFAVPDELFGNYTCYRLTFGGGSKIQVAEVEFLAWSADGEAGTLSEKPTLPTDTTATEPTPPVVDPPVTTDTPTSTASPIDPIDPIAPSTDDPTANPSENPSSLGLIIGLSVGLVVLLGGGVTFLLVYKKNKKA